jgi:hypothetical protein
LGDRLNRLKELLTGTPSSVKLQRIQEQLQSNRPRNALLAVLLHACSRLEQGETLGDIEAKMVSIVGRNYNLEQLKELGRIYQTMTAEQRAAFFPENLATLPLTQSYSKADFKAELKNIATKMRSDGSVKTVDINQLSADSTNSEDSTLRSGSSSNVMATDYTAPSARSQQSTGTKYAEIKLTRFQCLHESTEWSNSDEPFFGIAGSSDLGVTINYRPPVFRDVDKGEYHNFPAPAMAFQGCFEKEVCLNIEIHEKDQGTGWDSLRFALQEIGAALLDGAEELAGEEDCELAMMVLEISGIVCYLLAGMFGSFDDDFICERTLRFNRDALLALNEQEISERFDGGKAGAYEVYFTVHVTGDFSDAKLPINTVGQLFENTNFQGANTILQAKNYETPVWQQIKSLTVNDGYQIQLYEYSSFHGRAVSRTSKDSSFNGYSPVSSIKVKWAPNNVTFPAGGDNNSYQMVNKQHGTCANINYAMGLWYPYAMVYHGQFPLSSENKWLIHYDESGFCSIAQYNSFPDRLLCIGSKSVNDGYQLHANSSGDTENTHTWMLVKADENYFYVVNTYSGKAMTPQYSEYGSLIQKTLNYQPEQMWKFESC